MKNVYLRYITVLLFTNLYCTTSPAQTITTQTFSAGRIAYKWQTQKRNAFHLSIDQTTQTMTVIPLSPEFQGIKSLSICQNRVGNPPNPVSDSPICTTEFIIPWHPDTRHEVPLPQELFDCIHSMESYSWRVVWMMEE